MGFQFTLERAGISQQVLFQTETVWQRLAFELSLKEAKRAGIREVIFKPLTRPELFAAIDRALSAP